MKKHINRLSPNHEIDHFIRKIQFSNSIPIQLGKDEAWYMLKHGIYVQNNKILLTNGEQVFDLSQGVASIEFSHYKSENEEFLDMITVSSVTLTRIQHRIVNGVLQYNHPNPLFPQLSILPPVGALHLDEFDNDYILYGDEFDEEWRIITRRITDSLIENFADEGSRSSESKYPGI